MVKTELRKEGVARRSVFASGTHKPLVAGSNPAAATLDTKTRACDKNEWF